MEEAFIKERGSTEMKKIYITGAAGLLGCNLAYLLKNDYQIFGCDIIKTQFKSIHYFDMLNDAQLEHSILFSNPDVIVHTAAATNVDFCEEHPKEAELFNSKLTENICYIGQKNHIPVIYISTDAVFDGKSNTLYKETDCVNPLNIYAKTKLLGEQHVMENPINVVLRTNIYGYNMQDKYSFGEWILYSLLSNKPIHLFDDIVFSPILVNDLAYIISKIIDTQTYGLYHVCGTGSITKYSFGKEIEKHFCLKAGNIICEQSDNFPFKAIRSKNMAMSNSKIMQVLGLRIRTPIESIIEFEKIFKQGYPNILKQLKG